MLLSMLDPVRCSSASKASKFAIEEFLAVEQRKDLLRLTTAGSVDDGKSTLIGRLLHDSRSVYEDQIKSMAKASVNRSTAALDFSLLTDGLRAEREQGITIDVAYRYFATTRHKFIIADTPGHEQYTRNMATGASTADLAIILLDARKGVLPQSRRHAFIASLLGIPRFVVAINKIDLIKYDEAVFRSVRSIVTFDGDLPAAYGPMSVTLTLRDEIDISRGDMISGANSVPHAARHLEATVVWMHLNALEPHKPYLIKHTTQTVKAEIKSIRHRVNVHTFDREQATSLELNAIGLVETETARPLFFDAYTENRFTGSIIIIDPSNNVTVGAGMILRPAARKRVRAVQPDGKIGRVTPGERLGRFGHAGAIVSVGPRLALAELIERRLFDCGCAVAIADSEDAASVLQSAGLIAILNAGPEIFAAGW